MRLTSRCWLQKFLRTSMGVCVCVCSSTLKSANLWSLWLETRLQTSRLFLFFLNKATGWNIRTIEVIRILIYMAKLNNVTNLKVRNKLIFTCMRWGQFPKLKLQSSTFPFLKTKQRSCGRHQSYKANGYPTMGNASSSKALRVQKEIQKGSMPLPRYVFWNGT